MSGESDTLASVTARGATTATATTFSGGLTASGTGTGLSVTNNATVGGTLDVTGAITGSNLSGTNTGNVTLSGQNFLSISGQAITVAAINLSGSNVVSTLGLGNGGTGATTAQGAINNISGLTTNGDLLYHNGTNSIRLARGSNGNCLTSTATTIQWGSCGAAGASTSLNNLTATSINQSLIAGSNNTLDLGSSSVGWRSGYFGTAVYAPVLDRGNAGVLTIGGTNATSISLADNTVLAAGLSLTLTGGNTASRPSSPSEGMVYYDNQTKQLLTYANGKWQADRSDALYVAANNSSAADKASADYIADGTADQAEINSALTAASGKKVVLLAGTYIASASISVPNNTTLAGVGNGTVIELADIDATDDLVENSDTTTGTGITVLDLKLNGRKDLNTAGTQRGIVLSNMGAGSGAGARQGGTIENVTVVNFRSGGIRPLNSANNTISGNTIQEINGPGIVIDSSANNTITGNTATANVSGISIGGASSTGNTITGNITQGNSTSGISLGTNSSNNTVTGNTSQGNTQYGIYLNSSMNNTITSNTTVQNDSGIRAENNASHNTISANTVSTNSSYGIYLSFAANDNTITGNNMHNNGGATTNNGIYLAGTTRAKVSSNKITDTSCTTDCFAINIQSNSANAYLSGNIFSTTSGTATINDASTSTIYANQSTTQNSPDVSFRGTSAASYVMQVTNTSTANTADGMLINLGVANGSRATGNYFIGFAGAGTVAGKIQGGASAVAYTTTGADYAEYFRADPDDLPQPGELVTLDPDRPNGVKRAVAGDMIAGIISTDPGFIGNGPLCQVDDEDCDSNYEKWNVLVSLVGQVPVKTTGPVQIGDKIGSSTELGIASRVTEGYSIGRALTTPDEDGYVQVLIRAEHTPPQLQGTDSTMVNLSLTGNLSVGGDLNVMGSATMVNLTIAQDLEVGNKLVVKGITETKDIIIAGHTTSKGAKPTILGQASLGVGASVEVSGTDGAGTVVLNSGADSVAAGVLARISFAKQYTNSPRVVVSALNEAAAGLTVYVTRTTDGFSIVSRDPIEPGVQYEFDYIVQAATN